MATPAHSVDSSWAGTHDTGWLFYPSQAGSAEIKTRPLTEHVQLFQEGFLTLDLTDLR